MEFIYNYNNLRSMDKTTRSSSARNNQGDKCFLLQVYCPTTAGLRTPSLPRAQEQIEKRTTMCSQREDRHRDTDTQKETIRERERGVLNELDKELGCFWVLQVWRKSGSFLTQHKHYLTVTQTHSAKETTKQKQPHAFTVVQKREFCDSVGKQRERERERERERDEVKFTKGGGRNVFKTGVQLTAAADLESVWEPRGGGGEEHRNLMSDHRPSTGLRFFLGASNLEDLWEKGPSRGFEVLTGSSLKPGRSAREGTFQRV
jgi:hypothetical protein